MSTAPSKAVFISYASQDAEAAHRICEALRAGGVEVWFDRNELRGGDLWDKKIRQQIRDCALFIPVISSTTQARPEGYFRLEWRLAVERTHLMSDRVAFLLPVVVDRLDNREADVPDAFRAVQWTQLPNGQAQLDGVALSDGAAQSDGVALSEFVKRVLLLLSPSSPRITPSGPTERPVKNSKSSLSVATWLVGVLLLVAASYVVLEKVVLPRRGAQVAGQSIAVLPFADMSEQHDQEYFSDGLAEELLNLLAKTPGLHVIARTSSFYFKGKQVTLAEIAKSLGVANILEGSVRKSGDHLRVSTQLFVASSGEEIWSESYDLEFKDVFKVQDEIAGAVAAALRLKLVPTQGIADRETSNVEAYALLLQARQFGREAGADNKNKAVDAYQKAIALDPRYAEAYAELAIMQNYIADFSSDAAGYAAAMASAEKAVALAPDQADGYAARGVLRLTTNFDWSGAQADLSKALAIKADDSKVQARYAYVTAAVGRVAEATVAIKKSLAADPLSVSAWGNLSLYAIADGDYAGAHAALAHALELNPQSTYSLKNLGKLQLLEGYPAAASATFGACKDEVFRLYGVAMAEFSLGDVEKSQQALDELLAKHSDEAQFQIATVYAWRGEKDAAFTWLERSYVGHDGGLIEIKTEPLLRSLRGDPRYEQFLHRIKMPD